MFLFVFLSHFTGKLKHNMLVALLEDAAHSAGGTKESPTDPASVCFRRPLVANVLKRQPFQLQAER